MRSSVSSQHRNFWVPTWFLNMSDSWVKLNLLPRLRPRSRLEGTGSTQGLPHSIPAASFSDPASLSSCIYPASYVDGSGPTGTNPFSCQPHPLVQWLCVHPPRAKPLYCFVVAVQALHAYPRMWPFSTLLCTVFPFGHHYRFLAFLS